MCGIGSFGLVSCHTTSLPAVDGNRGDPGLLDPPDQTDGVLQLKPATRNQLQPTATQSKARLCCDEDVCDRWKHGRTSYRRQDSDFTGDGYGNS